MNAINYEQHKRRKKQNKSLNDFGGEDEFKKRRVRDRNKE